MGDEAARSVGNATSAAQVCGKTTRGKVEGFLPLFFALRLLVAYYKTIGTKSNLDIYRRLLELEAELRRLADQCLSPAGATALRSAAGVVRRLANAFYKTLDPD